MEQTGRGLWAGVESSDDEGPSELSNKGSASTGAGVRMLVHCSNC
jgi:hypothetical protein